MTYYLQTSYLVRLACFSLTSFFLMNAVLALATSLSAPAAVHFGARLQPRLAARFILSLRLLPCGLALFAVAGLCVPSYLWLEPKGTSEQVGLWCWASRSAMCLDFGNFDRSRRSGVGRSASIHAALPAIRSGNPPVGRIPGTVDRR